jgi:hypothetical protein
MKVLSQCTVRGSYRWHRTTPSTDYIEIKSEDELYAKLPLGAASLQGELEASGQLSMETIVAGQYRLGLDAPGKANLEGRCAGATHILDGLAVGAFELKAGAEKKGSVKAEATVAGVGAGAGGSRGGSKYRIRQAGNLDNCGATEEAPDPSCASPIQMFLIPANAPQQTLSTGGAAGFGQAPGSSYVEIDIVSAEPDVSWDVYLDSRKTCTTPCRQSVASVGSGIMYGLIGAGFAVPCFTTDDSDRAGAFCTMAGMSGAMGAVLFAAGTYWMESKGSAKTSPLR